MLVEKQTDSFIVELSSAVYYKNIKAMADLLNHAVMGAVNEQDEVSELKSILRCSRTDTCYCLYISLNRRGTQCSCVQPILKII